MIRFFRKIRYDLMEKNKTGKYLKYAIGEILLVVIGILIALGINNWNSTRLDKNKGIEVLNVIVNELESNQQYLSNLMLMEEKKLASSTKLAKYFGSPPPLIDVDSFYRWSEILSDIPPFAPKNTNLLSIINAGQLELITNDSLKYILTDYQSKLIELGGDYEYGKEVWKILILPFESKNISKVKHYQLRYHTQKDIDSAFEWKISDVMSNREYENIIIINMALAEFKISKLQRYIEHIETMKGAINNEINF